MPAKPRWVSRLPLAIEELKAAPKPYVDRPVVEQLLGVGRRRAQQIMGPCVTDQVGSTGLADRQLLVEHLQRLASGEQLVYEARRRKHVGTFLQKEHEQRLISPSLLVEAPVDVINQTWDKLPPGIELGRGFITARFSSPQEGLELLLSLAMAIANDFASFDKQVSLEDPVLP